MLTISDVKPYSKNAKKHPAKQLRDLANIVKEVGWRQPVLVNAKGVIIAGHGRFMTYQKHQESHMLKEVWIIDDSGNTIAGGPETTPMTEQQEITYRLADNKLAESDWEMDLVVEDMYQLSDDMRALTGFDPDLLLEPDERDDKAPKKPEKTKVKEGDVYQLGEHRVMCGDATKIKDVEVLMKGRKADMVFTDPPYNVNYSGRGKKTSNKIKNDHMESSDFEKFLNDVFLTYKLFTQEEAGMYVCYASSSHREFENALNAQGFSVAQQIIWVKAVASMGWGHYRWKHEPIFYCRKDGAKTNYYGDRKQYTTWEEEPTDEQLLEMARHMLQEDQEEGSTVWKMHRDSQYEHPTQKPVMLCAKGIVNSSKRGDVVLDLFGGSGSTLIAAEKTERSCYAMELDPKYVEVIIRRFIEYTGEKVYNITDGKKKDVSNSFV